MTIMLICNSANMGACMQNPMTPEAVNDSQALITVATGGEIMYICAYWRHNLDCTVRSAEPQQYHLFQCTLKPVHQPQQRPELHWTCAAVESAQRKATAVLCAWIRLMHSGIRKLCCAAARGPAGPRRLHPQPTSKCALRCTLIAVGKIIRVCKIVRVCICVIQVVIAQASPHHPGNMLDLREVFTTLMEAWREGGRLGQNTLLAEALPPLLLAADATGQRELLVTVHTLMDKVL